MSFAHVMRAALAVCLVTTLAACDQSNKKNKAPEFTSAATVSVPEGQTDTGYVAQASDPNRRDTLTYSVSGGADAAQLSIDTNSGALSFVTAPEFINPADGNGDNVYEVEITADDGRNRNNTATLSIQVTVTSVNQPPLFTSAAAISVTEGSVATGYTATADDANGDILTFSISGGADQALLSIDSASGALAFNAAPEFANPQDADADNLYDLELTVDDGRMGSDTLIVAVTVLEQSNFSLQMTFPTPNANLGGSATQTTLSGNIIDSNGLPIDLADIDYVNINGASATLDVANPGRWSLQIPVSAGDNAVDLELGLTSGAQVISSEILQNSAIHGGFGDSYFDVVNGVIYVVDNTDDVLLSVDTTTGDRTVVSGAGVGAGTSLSNPRGLAIDAANDRALISDWQLDAIISLDLSTGDRTVLSSPSVGTGDVVDGPNDLTLDSANNRVLVASFNTAAVVAVDLSSGDRTTVSDPSTGTGPDFLSMQGISLDSANNRALVSDSSQDAVVAVDLTSGDRTILSDAVTGTGPDLSSILDSVIDTANNRLLVADLTRGLFAIDLSSGDRTLIDAPTDDFGLNSSRIQSVALDAANGIAYVPDSTQDVIFAVELSTGDRSIASSNSVGDGPIETNMWGVQGITHDRLRNRLLLSNWQSNLIAAVDLGSGDRTVVSSDIVGTGPILSWPTRLVIDAANNRAVFPERTLKALLAMDLDTGDRTILSDNTSVGTGPLLNFPIDVFVDSANDWAAVLDATNGLIGITLSTGDRSIISDAVTGAGPMWGSADALDIDASANTGYVADDADSALYQVDTLTGDRTIFSSNAGVGTGPGLDFPNDLILDLGNNRALILNRGSRAELMAVDITTGDRSVVSGSGVGSGPSFRSPHYIELDLQNNRAFIYDLAVTGVIVVELSTGERALASK